MTDHSSRETRRGGQRGIHKVQYFLLVICAAAAPPLSPIETFVCCFQCHTKVKMCSIYYNTASKVARRPPAFLSMNSSKRNQSLPPDYRASFQSRKSKKKEKKRISPTPSIISSSPSSSSLACKCDVLGHVTGR